MIHLEQLFNIYVALQAAFLSNILILRPQNFVVYKRFKIIYSLVFNLNFFCIITVLKLKLIFKYCLIDLKFKVF